MFSEKNAVLSQERVASYQRGCLAAWGCVQARVSVGRDVGTLGEESVCDILQSLTFSKCQIFLSSVLAGL